MNVLKFARWKIVMAVTAVGLSLAPVVAPSFAYAACAPGDPQCVDVCGNATNCNLFVENYINPLVKVLTALVGISAVISIIVAGIQYSSSADDPGTVTKAKQRVFNVVIGLLAYIFLIALLNYLIPGGIW